MDVDMRGYSSAESMSGQQSGSPGLIDQIIALRPKYVGIYAPGDFKVPTYRLVVPYQEGHKHGRGFHGAREEIVAETSDRQIVNRWIGQCKAMLDMANGPLAVRHVANPSCNKDEGLRLVWPGDGPSGDAEVADWPRRDRMLREGKTVQPMEESIGWSPDVVPQGSGACWITLPVGSNKAAMAGQSVLSTPVSPVVDGCASTQGGRWRQGQPPAPPQPDFEMRVDLGNCE